MDQETFWPHTFIRVPTKCLWLLQIIIIIIIKIAGMAEDWMFSQSDAYMTSQKFNPNNFLAKFQRA